MQALITAVPEAKTDRQRLAATKMLPSGRDPTAFSYWVRIPTSKIT